MTQDEYDVLALGRKVPAEAWQKAFNEYNKDNNQMLSMGCRSCFFKVLEYLRKKYNLQHKAL